MTTIPDFYTLNQQQKPAGTYDLYASCNGVGAESWPKDVKTATITLCQWNQHPHIKSKTRVHKTSFIVKVKVDVEHYQQQIEILQNTVKALNDSGDVYTMDLHESIVASLKKCHEMGKVTEKVFT